MRKIIYIAFVALLATNSYAQTKTKQLTVAHTFTEQVLESLTADFNTYTNELNEQALHSQYELDKRNKPLMDKMKILQHKMQDNYNDVMGKYKVQADEIIRRQGRLKPLISQAASAVAQESGLPKKAQYNMYTGVWTVEEK